MFELSALELFSQLISWIDALRDLIFSSASFLILLGPDLMNGEN